jgi:hypothetical protein
MGIHIGSQYRETLDEAGYEVVRLTKEQRQRLCVGRNEKILCDKGDRRDTELWFKNDHHSGYTIEINGVGYEFARGVTL